MPNVPQKGGQSCAGPERRSARINLPPLPAALPAQEPEKATQSRLQNTSLNQMGDTPRPYSGEKNLPFVINKWDWTKEVLGVNNLLIFLIKRNLQIKRSLLSQSSRPLSPRRYHGLKAMPSVARSWLLSPPEGKGARTPRQPPPPFRLQGKTVRKGRRGDRGIQRGPMRGGSWELAQQGFWACFPGTEDLGLLSF